MLNEMQAKYVKKSKQCIDSHKQHEKKSCENDDNVERNNDVVNNPLL